MFNRILIGLLPILLFVLTSCTSTPEPKNLEFEWPTPIVEVAFEPMIPQEVVEQPIPLVEMHMAARVRFTDAEIRCIADVIYFEARGEPPRGKYGVGYTVLNRMAHHKFPDTACGVIYDRRHGCQFSWACKGTPYVNRNTAVYRSAETAAVMVMQRMVDNPIDDSLFFRATWVKQQSRNQVRRARIAGHDFYALR